MLESSTLLTIVPPIVSAFFAYLVARKKNILSERVSNAKLKADIQIQALDIVKGVMDDMKEEFRKEIDSLRGENKELRQEIEDSRHQLTSMQTQLKASDELVSTLKSELITLRATIKLYEDELARLRKGK